MIAQPCTTYTAFGEALFFVCCLIICFIFDLLASEEGADE